MMYIYKVRLSKAHTSNQMTFSHGNTGTNVSPKFDMGLYCFSKLLNYLIQNALLVSKNLNYLGLLKPCNGGTCLEVIYK